MTNEDCDPDQLIPDLESFINGGNVQRAEFDGISEIIRVVCIPPQYHSIYDKFIQTLTIIYENNWQTASSILVNITKRIIEVDVRVVEQMIRKELSDCVIQWVLKFSAEITGLGLEITEAYFNRISQQLKEVLMLYGDTNLIASFDRFLEKVKIICKNNWRVASNMLVDSVIFVFDNSYQTHNFDNIVTKEQVLFAENVNQEEMLNHVITEVQKLAEDFINYLKGKGCRGGLKAVVIYGSVARKQARFESDIDIAAVFDTEGENISTFEYIRYEEEWERFAGNRIIRFNFSNHDKTLTAKFRIDTTSKLFLNSPSQSYSVVSGQYKIIAVDEECLEKVKEFIESREI